ncbi:MAG: beta galactosidase jelly roll domain-containing protein [Lentisphaeria bacterium]|nr:beta galactosidase jelly roll domain-containing protein [Lentisphaeria bacterium]NQZ70858.1 beta galactosidase jelly roll domain-containing protein [Lentisphaeria bacterium]
MRINLSLNGDWEACLDPEDQGESQSYQTGEGSDWHTITVPGDFSQLPGDDSRYEGVGWYRKTIQIPEDWQGKYISLNFEAVNKKSKIWINGEQIGRNRHAFLPFKCEVDDKFCGTEAQLVLRVDNTQYKDHVPGVGRGWHPFGGIIREVNLEAKSQCRIDNAYITSLMDGNFSCDVSLSNDSDDFEGSLCIRVQGQDFDQEMDAQVVDLKAGETISIQAENLFSGTENWSPDSPALYTAELELHNGDEIVDSTSIRFGFRTIRRDGCNLYINDKPFYMTGYNFHADSAETNMCITADEIRKDFTIMKDTGCNTVRLAHYPHHPHTLDLCDELGLMALTEIPLYWWRGHGGEGDEFKNVVKMARKQITRLINRDRSHPSVISWSVGNENDSGKPGVNETIDDLIRYAREMDPTRLIIHVSNHWQPGYDHTDRFGEDDIICLNAYPNPEIGHEFWIKGFKKLHKEYPNTPIMVAEFGGGPANQGPSYETLFGALAEHFETEDAHYVVGSLIWCWADHRWPSELDEFSPYGILTREREPRPSFEIAGEGFKKLQERFK